MGAGGVIKRLTRHGNSLALIIDKSILELLRIDADTPLSVATDGECLVVSPARGAGRQRRFRRALEDVNKRYSGALKRLAE
jgi:antitoxin component of MazEF toxin-antitoxin module